jgi:TPR repeat protein
VNAKFSRDQEREADDLGIQYMTKAGYDPYAARRFWDLMESKGGGESGLWMSSHPSNVERKGTLSALAAAYSPNKTTDPPLPKYDDPYPPAMYSSLEPSLEESSAEPLGSYANGRTLYKAGRIEEALPFLQKAAESGDERAALLIGECEQAGRLGLPDYTKARENFQLAAKMGLSAGITGLAMQSLSGKGAPLDHKEGARLLSIAAGRGEPRAYGLLALMYMEGVEPFPRDLIMTRQLAEKSAAAGDGAGRAILGVLLRNGVGGDANQQRSFALLTLAVNDSKINTFAQYNLGVSYETGAGTPVDKAKAVELYRLAASRQFQPAVERLKVLKLSQ